jgi:RNA polymerase sigma-70 factor, ECF subfamily
MAECGHPAAAKRGDPMHRDLVIRARSGDHDAFSTLAAAAADRLHRTAWLILRSDDDAADAVQDALLAAWLHIAAVRDPERFDAWLNRLLVHACYRLAKRSGRRVIVEIPMAAPDAPGPRDLQDDLATRDQFERAFRRLTPEQRAALVVHHFLGLPDAEAASVLGIAVGTFKSRLHRASAAMRATVEADERLPAAVKESIA